MESGSKIDVLFSHPLNITLGVDDACGDIIAAQTLRMLGTNATCRMRGDKVVVVSFGTNPNITIGNDIEFANVT